MTQLEIANLALHHIGQKAVSSLTAGTSVQADAILRIWTQALEETLRSNNWGFAKVVEELTEIDDYDSLEWTYGYTYPANAVIVRLIYNEGTADKNIGERFELVYDTSEDAVVIVTDCADAYAEYTYNQTDTTFYDATFVNALSHRLASDLAVNLDGDKDMAKNELTIFNTVISEAKRISKGEDYKPKERASSYEDAR